jgi:hypothetical protein
MIYTGNVQGEAAQALADAHRWFITAGDSDLDRPREHTTYA